MPDNDDNKIDGYIERRDNIGTIEFRAEGEGGGKEEKKYLRGYAARFNTIADLYWFDEEIMPGAFSESIEKDDIRALINHDSNLILGRNRANTLELFEDGEGLYSKIDPPETKTAQDIIVSVERGDVTQMSFQFIVQEETWIYSDERESKNDLRQIKKAQLRDVSIVTFPAYTTTSLSYRDISTCAPEFRSIKNIYELRAKKPLPKIRYREFFNRYVSRLQLNN